MKFLIDRCAGRRLADWLRSQGHDVLESRSLGDDPGDEALLGRASAEGRAVITIDTDFGTLVFLRRAPHRGIVRLPDVPPAARIELMRQILECHAQALAQGAVISVRGNRIRISHPPQRRG